MSGTAARRAVVAAVADTAATAAVSPARMGIPRGFSSGEDTRARVLAGRNRVGLLRQIVYVAIDVALVCVGGAIVFRALAPNLGIRVFAGSLALSAALVILACKSQHLYRTPKEISAVQESGMVLRAVGVVTALFALFVFTAGKTEISREAVICAGALNFAALAGWRYLKRVYVLRRAARGVSSTRALVVGAGAAGRAFASWLETNRHLGYAVCGFLDAQPSGEAHVLGSLEDFRRVALEKFVDQVFVVLPAERESVKEICLEARRLRLDVNVVPDLYDGLGWNAPVHAIGGYPMLELHAQPIPAFGLAAKRMLDILLGCAGFALSLPILGIAAVWIAVDSPGPIFYSAMRVGRKGTKFRCLKLRTMVAGADSSKESLRRVNERVGPFFKMGRDPRVTRCGAWLRKFSVDELPQFLNVIAGDMSLVGPRPHPLDDVELYRAEDLRRLDVKPGVTGLWQVTARRDPSFETNMALDLKYIESWSLALDVKILLKTLPVVLRAEGN
jgi:exopolysaccharide biosynthesis polyprenyl glycosylphosphotransferase